MTIGKMIKKQRIIHDMVLWDVTAATGLSTTYLSEIERGMRRFNDLGLLIKLMEVFKLDVVGMDEFIIAFHEENKDGQIHINLDCPSITDINMIINRLKPLMEEQKDVKRNKTRVAR